MSRLAKKPIMIPEGVDFAISGQDIKVKGKLGELSLTMISEMGAESKEGNIVLTPKSESRFAFNMWGTTHSLIRGMVEGVTVGFKKELDIQGVGYRAALQGKDLVLQLGYSHEVRYPVPTGIKIECPSQTDLVISGIDKQLVGQVSAEIIKFRPPEPYKGKGIRYKGQEILRKEGKKK